MKALLLAAGYGTRLYPLTENLSKVLLPVNNKPVIEYLIKKLLVLELTKVYIVTNNRFYKQLTQWCRKSEFENKTHNDFTLKVINDFTHSDKDKLGAIGDINHVIGQEKINDDLLILAADNLIEQGLSEFVRFSKKNLNFPTVGVKKFQNKKLLSKYGVVRIDNKNKIVKFDEKPETPQSDIVAMGIYFFPRKSLNLVEKYLNKGNSPDAIGFFIKWLSENYAVYAYEFKGDWFDIGSKEVYKLAGGDLV